MIGMIGVVLAGKKFGSRINNIWRIRYCIIVRPCREAKGSWVRSSKSRNNKEHKRPIKIRKDDNRMDIIETRT
jgi:hypothetical protein